MKNALLIILLASLNGPQVFAKTLRVNVYDLPPHIFIENGKARGPGITFYETYLKETPDASLQWVVTPFARVLHDLQNDRADVALFLARTPEREKFLRFSNTPLFTTASAIIVRSDSPLAKAKSLKDFRGLTLGHSKDSFVPHELIRNGIKIEPLSGEKVVERNIQKLRNKRLDGIFLPTASNGEYSLHKLKVEKEFHIFIVPNSNLNLYVAFRKNIDEKTFLRIEKELKKHQDAYLKLLLQQFEK